MTPAGQAPLSPAPPGAVLGVLGGGQLGRMFAHAAQRLGYRVRVLSPQAGSPAGEVASEEHVGAFTDLRAVDRFADGLAGVTLEFENVPLEALEAAARRAPVRPAAGVLGVTQHRVREKNFLRDHGAPIGAFAPVSSLVELQTAAAALGFPAVLKTAQMGYDGRGQRVLRSTAELTDAWAALGPGECILEAFVPFVREVSVIVARGADGQTALYGPFENTHAHHILDVSVYPAPNTDPATAAEAARVATAVAQELRVVGLLCVEMFELADGSLLVNELAPRPHNSGHLTIEGCRTGQFEQQARATAGLPLGPTDPVAPAAMANLLGDLWFDADGHRREPDWPAALRAGATLHLYGKADPQPGRKMGHLTALADTPQRARERALAARGALVTGSLENR